eukprot:10682085-Alexandrium_andersonii.AAC.1
MARSFTTGPGVATAAAPAGWSPGERTAAPGAAAFARSALTLSARPWSLAGSRSGSAAWRLPSPAPAPFPGDLCLAGGGGVG